MKIVFIGATRIGLRCLDIVQQMQNVEVVGVITNRKRFSISYAPEGVENVLYADFMGYGRQHDIPTYVMESKMSEPGLIEKVRQWQPDLLLVVGWYHRVPRILRDIAPAAGLHASLLPDYSGGAPLVWAIINGEKKTGITFFQLADGVDDGPIIGQKAVDILPDDTIATLYKKIEVLGIELIKEYLPKLADGSAILIPQDNSQRRVFPQRKPKDGKIDWTQSAQRIYDFIRAQTHPYPGAFTTLNGRKLTVWRAELFESAPVLHAQPGEIIRLNDGRMIVACGDGELQLTEVSLEGMDDNAAKKEICHSLRARLI